jgi:hypothetical protein
VSATNRELLTALGAATQEYSRNPQSDGPVEIADLVWIIRRANEIIASADTYRPLPRGNDEATT